MPNKLVAMPNTDAEQMPNSATYARPRVAAAWIATATWTLWALCAALPAVAAAKGLSGPQVAVAALVALLVCAVAGRDSNEGS